MYFGNQYEIIHVNGENGARSLQMAPNSNVLLLDEKDPLVWLVRTDGAGYKTVQPYKIEPFVPDPPVDVKKLVDLVDKLTDKIYELEERMNESNTTTVKSKPNVKPSADSEGESSRDV